MVRQCEQCVLLLLALTLDASFLIVKLQACFFSPPKESVSYIVPRRNSFLLQTAKEDSIVYSLLTNSLLKGLNLSGSFILEIQMQRLQQIKLRQPILHLSNNLILLSLIYVTDLKCNLKASPLNLFSTTDLPQISISTKFREPLLLFFHPDIFQVDFLVCLPAAKP